MPHRLARWLPTAALGFLLGGVTMPFGRLPTAAPLANPYPAWPHCEEMWTEVSGQDTLSIGTAWCMVQPLGRPTNAAACSVTGAIQGYLSSARITLVEWDPVAMIPDPNTVAIRSVKFWISSNWPSNPVPRLNLVDGLVRRKVAHVADPPRPDMAMLVAAGTPATFKYRADADSSVPQGRYGYELASSPLPGPHPALDHALCLGDAGLQSLHVLQCVATANAALDTAAYVLAQRFRVPQGCRVDRVELAHTNAAPYRDPLEYGTVAILDGAGGGVIPNGPTLAEASFLADRVYAQWFSHPHFDQGAALVPEHDYWLVATVRHDYLLRARILTGAESADFQASIGPLYRRTDPSEPWALVPDRALSFRLIGVPDGVLAVDPHGARDGLAMEVVPNPAHGLAWVRWAGARGPVSLEVFDVSGRRIASATAATSSGVWPIPARARSAAGSLPGTYFVRIRDGAGMSVTRRIVRAR